MKPFDRRAPGTEVGPVGCLINEVISRSSVQTLLRCCESHLCFPSYVTLDKLFNLSEPLHNRDHHHLCHRVPGKMDISFKLMISMTNSSISKHIHTTC